MGYLGTAKVQTKNQFEKLVDFTDVVLEDAGVYIVQPNRACFIISSATVPENGFVVSENEMTQFVKRMGEDIYIKTMDEKEVRVIITD